jgi:hypothetical protein
MFHIAHSSNTNIKAYPRGSSVHRANRTQPFVPGTPVSYPRVFTPSPYSPSDMSQFSLPLSSPDIDARSAGGGGDTQNPLLPPPPLPSSSSSPFSSPRPAVPSQRPTKPLAVGARDMMPRPQRQPPPPLAGVAAAGPFWTKEKV